MKNIIKLFTLLLMTIGYHAQAKPLFKTEKPGISKAFFGITEGKEIYQYTLRNSKGMMVKAINYGGSITGIITPDKNNEPGNIVLGFDSLKSYTGRMNALMGAIVGRVANRISNKKFTLDGKEYILSSNIHGGLQGFNKKFWDIEEITGINEMGLKMTYFSKDGEEGYPGNLQVTVTYTLTNNNELKITYSATTDKACPVVLTNHTYFNLSAGKEENILNTDLNIFADQFLDATPGPFPTGKLSDVEGTPFDFTKTKKIGKQIADNYDQLKMVNGYDLTYVLRNQSGKLALAAIAYEPVSGRVMQVYTTEPGLVFYSGNYLNEKVIGSGGKPSTKNGAFCLETQHYPDSPNHINFPNTILRPGEIFHSQTVYRFSVHQ